MENFIITGKTLCELAI